MSPRSRFWALVLAVLSVSLPRVGLQAGEASGHGSARLVGTWKATIEFGKMRMGMRLRIQETNGHRLTASMDLPEQGAQGLPIEAVLVNPPDVRLEIDNFGTAYVGRISDEGRTIRGQFEEGPGGRAIAIVFERDTAADLPPQPRSYVLAPDEKPDARGYWVASIEAGPGLEIRTGLKIGRLPDGNFEVLVDRFERGVRDAPATRSTHGEGRLTAEWENTRLKWEGQLSPDGQSMEGTWTEGPLGRKVVFRRLSRPATLFAEEVSLEPDPKDANDLRGEWHGVLEPGGGARLRIVLKIGRLPNGSLAGALSSPDQGGGELPATKGRLEEGKLRMEWPAIGGVFAATWNGTTRELSGAWDQGGRSLPLVLRRPAAAAVSTPNR